MRLYRIRKFPTKLFIVFLVVLAAFLSLKFLPGVKDFSLEILAKPLKFISSLRAHFSRASDLKEENFLLKQRLGALSVELARTGEIEEENRRLKKLLKFRESSRFKSVAAEVIARDSVDWRRSLIINKGTKDGVKERAPCVTGKGFIGSVVEAGPATSKIMLVTDPNSRVGVILKASRECGLLIGSGAGLCKVIYLSLDEKIEKGDAVITAGFGDYIPKGLMVGEVVGVGVEKTNLYKYAVVKSFENMNAIEEVICIEAR